jgi:hypothetical protein
MARLRAKQKQFEATHLVPKLLDFLALERLIDVGLRGGDFRKFDATQHCFGFSKLKKQIFLAA